ncbi:hypothetical protein T484DRAFT_2266701, partial [Baffinella frigidus]
PPPTQVARLTSSASVDAFARNIAKQDLDQHRHTLLAGLSADPLPAWAPLPPVRVAARTPTSFARKAASILEPLNHPAQHAPAHRGFGGGSQAPPTLFGPSPALSFPPPSYESLNGDLGAPPWYTLHPTPYTLHPTPETRHPKPETRNPEHEIRNPKPETRNPKPETRHSTPDTRHPTHETRNPTPGKRNPTPDTRNPKPATR